jgi:hypothetical protein
MGTRKRKTAAMNFKTMLQSDVPQGRNGKHRYVVSQIISDLDQVEPGVALKVPLASWQRAKKKSGRHSIVPPAKPDGSWPRLPTRTISTSGMRAAINTAGRLLRSCCRGGSRLGVPTAELFHNVAHEHFCVPKKHQRLVHVIERIIDAGETWIHTALDHHHSV